MTERVFGEIENCPEGRVFDSRLELSTMGVHRPLQAGISGSEREGADSIVLSGGYEDDEDHGDVIVYTGHGGRNPGTGQQVSDQLLTRGNLALAVSCQEGMPVRVVRGSGHESRYSPEYGYRYDGQYRVDRYWRERGQSGHIVWRYRLSKIEEDPAIQRALDSTPEKAETIVQRIIRNSILGKRVKEMYDYHCQVCEIRLEGSAGGYAEAAHLRPLGMTFPPNSGEEVNYPDDKTAQTHQG